MKSFLGILLIFVSFCTFAQEVLDDDHRRIKYASYEEDLLVVIRCFSRGEYVETMDIFVDRLGTNPAKVDNHILELQRYLFGRIEDAKPGILMKIADENSSYHDYLKMLFPEDFE
jgi:hypothetical protein